MIAHKTKAALQSCLCHYQMFKREQNAKVSAGGQSLSRMHICTLSIVSVSFSKALKSASQQNQQINILMRKQSSKLSFASKLLIIPSLLTLGAGAGKFALQHNQKVKFLIKQQTSDLRFVYKPLIFSTPSLWFIDSWSYKNSGAQSLGSSLVFLRWSSLSFFRKDSSGNCIDLAFDSASTGCEFFCSFVMCQPLGSMPRCCSSLRMMRLIQAASDSSPSCCCACSISSRSSGSSLNWNGGLPRRSFLCVDTSITPDVMCLCVMTHYIQERQIATPRSAGTLPRRLTTNR